MKVISARIPIAISVLVFMAGCGLLRFAQGGEGAIGGPSLERSALQATYFTGGFCVAPCNGILEVSDRIARLTLIRMGGGGVAAVNEGHLTARGGREVRRLGFRLPRARLLAMYPGCGAACDGFSVTLVVGRAALAPQVIYAVGELEGAPKILREADRFLGRLRGALSRCRASELVAPNSGCHPVG